MVFQVFCRLFVDKTKNVVILLTSFESLTNSESPSISVGDPDPDPLVRGTDPDPVPVSDPPFSHTSKCVEQTEIMPAT